MQEWKLGDTTSSFLVALGSPCITLCDTVDFIFKRGDPGVCVTQRSRLLSKMTFLLNHRKYLEDVVEDSFACQSASLSLGLFPPRLDTEDSEMSQILTILALRGLTATGPGGHGLGLPESPWLCHPGLDSLPVPATPSPAQHWPEWPAAEDSASGVAQMRLPTRPHITASSVPELPQHAVPPVPPNELFPTGRGGRLVSASCAQSWHRPGERGLASDDHLLHATHVPDSLHLRTLGVQRPAPHYRRGR